MIHLRAFLPGRFAGALFIAAFILTATIAIVSPGHGSAVDRTGRHTVELAAMPCDHGTPAADSHGDLADGEDDHESRLESQFHAGATPVIGDAELRASRAVTRAVFSAPRSTPQRA